MLLPLAAAAQSVPELQITAQDIVQYQRAKASGRDVGSYFQRFGLKRTRALSYLSADDPRQVWFHHITADTAWTADKPLYRLFRRKDNASMAIIDDRSNAHSVQYVFWNKAYYRRLSQGLRQMGYTMTQDAEGSNVLRFRHPDQSVCVDITIWPDVYLVETTVK